MRSNLLRTVCRFSLAAGLAVAGSAVANAALISPNGSFAGALIGGTVTTTYTPGAWELGTTTTNVTITTGSRVISGAADPYLGHPNNMSSVNGGPVTIGDAFSVSNSSYNIVTGAVTPFTVSFDGFTFNLDHEVVTSRQNGNIGLAFIGSLTGAAAGYSTGLPVDFSVGLTESGPTGAIGVAYSIDTPINPTIAALVPEPATMAMFGMGLLGLVAVRRRRSISI
jgi:hypothetical protein